MTVTMLSNLADELDAARKAFVNSYGDPVLHAKAKQHMLQLLWDDKATIILALRTAAATEITLTNGER